MIKEIWKDVPGYEELYQVSSNGDVYSLISGKDLKPCSNDKGYQIVKLYSEPFNGTTTPIHRLVALAFLPNPDNKPQVNHKNGVKTDNRVENLEWMTSQDNVRHAYRNKLKSNDCQKSPTTIFNNSQVSEMRRMFSEGMTYREVANHFNARYDTTWKLIKGINYKNLHLIAS